MIVGAEHLTIRQPGQGAIQIWKSLLHWLLLSFVLPFLSNSNQQPLM
jgi:hypothetical protein